MRRRLSIALLVLVALTLPTACDPAGGAAPTPTTVGAPCDPTTATDCPPTTSGPPTSTSGGETTTTEEPAETTTTEESGETTTTGGTDDQPKQDGKIPDGKPVLIALGDSITSGHHKERGKDTICDLPEYGYPGELFKLLNGWKKDTWADPDQYQNVAHSGFGTAKVLGGGTNACGKEFKDPEIPVTQAVKLLGERKKAGNVVVLSMGVNDTNWTTVVTGIAQQMYASPPGNVFKLEAEQCEAWLLNGLNAVGPLAFKGLDFYPDERLKPATRLDDVTKLRAQIQANATEITRKLVEADPEVNIFTLRYYDIAGTGFSDTLNPVFKTVRGPYLPESCGDGIAKRVESLNKLVEEGMTAAKAFPQGVKPADRVSFVDVPELRRAGDKKILQSLFIDEIAGAVAKGQTPQPPGWPHPQKAGHLAAANKFLEAIKAKLGG